MNHTLIRRLTTVSIARAAVVLLLALGLSAVAFTGRSDASAASAAASKPLPTVVLVHGAFADSSGWSAVADDLTRRGYPVVAFSNPLRNPVADGEYLRQFLTTVPGPVVLVGHSYGGAVITNAATGNRNVKALVYVAAYAPAQGENLATANTLGGGSTAVTDHLVFRPYPGAPDGDGDAYIDAAWFRQLFAQDLPERVTRLMAATQRPAAGSSLLAPSGVPAWKTIPSWYLVANQDRIIPTAAELAMAKRAGSKTVRINSSHVAMMSHPDAVTALVVDAARSTAAK